MLRFKIFEIPEGHSERSIALDSEEFDLGDVQLSEGTVDIKFYRTVHFIRAEFSIEAQIELICDRSLDPFNYPVQEDYEVLFKADEVEETADENGAVRNYDHGSQQIDLEQDVRDTILVNLPTKKLHPRFLDENGEPKEMLNEQFGDIPDEDEETVDPRWDALKELKK